MTKAQRMRALINDDRICISPGVYDGYSIGLAQQMGYATASATGAGLANSWLGQAVSFGIMSMLDNVEAGRALPDAADIPFMAAAVTGTGKAFTVFHAGPRLAAEG